MIFNSGRLSLPLQKHLFSLKWAKTLLGQGSITRGVEKVGSAANNEDARQAKKQNTAPSQPDEATAHTQTQNKSINQWREWAEKKRISQRLSRPAAFLKERTPRDSICCENKSNDEIKLQTTTLFLKWIKTRLGVELN